MDAVEFFEEHDRMCNSFGGDCTGCEIYKVTMSSLTCNAFIFTRPREMVAIVERWAKEHPRKTRQSELLKLFPRVDMTADDVIAFCPESMDSAFACPIKERDHYDPECGECRKKYWLEEVEDDDQSND
jgi:hypothetical protein